jgi:hypothetical protein
MDWRRFLKKLEVTLRTVVFSTYHIEVEDDYEPKNGDQILEDWFSYGNDDHELVESDINDESVEDWSMS